MAAEIRGATGAQEGIRQRDRVLTNVERRRAYLTRLSQRTLLRKLLDGATLTTDDVRDELPRLPESVGRQFLGAAIRPFVAKGLIRSVGVQRSRFKITHGRALPVWSIADRAAAERWLADHPALPEPPCRAQLFPEAAEAN